MRAIARLEAFAHFVRTTAFSLRIDFGIIRANRTSEASIVAHLFHIVCRLLHTLYPPVAAASSHLHSHPVRPPRRLVDAEAEAEAEAGQVVGLAGAEAVGGAVRRQQRVDLLMGISAWMRLNRRAPRKNRTLKGAWAPWVQQLQLVRTEVDLSFLSLVSMKHFICSLSRSTTRPSCVQTLTGFRAGITSPKPVQSM